MGRHDFVNVDMDKLIKAMKEYRKENSLTQVELSVLAELSSSTISKIEQGLYENQIAETTFEKLKEIGICIESL